MPPTTTTRKIPGIPFGPGRIFLFSFLALYIVSLPTTAIAGADHEPDIDKAVGILKNQNNDWFKKVQAAQQLGHTGDIRAVRALIHAFRKERNMSVRAASAEALGRTGNPEAADFLMRSLGNEKKWNVRTAILRGITLSGSPRTTAMLIKALQSDPNVFVRKEAALSLGKVGGKAAVGPLKKALKDEGVVIHHVEGKDDIRVIRDVAEAAAEALKNLGVKVDAKALDFNWIEWDIRRLEHHADKHERAVSAWRLGMSKDEKAVPPLVRALLRDPAADVRRNAASSLGRLGDKRAIGSLIRVLESDHSFWVRISAARALIVFGDKRSVGAVKKALKDKKITATALGDDLKKIE